MRSTQPQSSRAYAYTAVVIETVVMEINVNLCKFFLTFCSFENVPIEYKSCSSRRTEHFHSLCSCAMFGIRYQFNSDIRVYHYLGWVRRDSVVARPTAATLMGCEIGSDRDRLQIRVPKYWRFV